MFTLQSSRSPPIILSLSWLLDVQPGRFFTWLYGQSWFYHDTSVTGLADEAETLLSVYQEALVALRLRMPPSGGAWNLARLFCNSDDLVVPPSSP